jgi:predicted lipid-binding transport protein (Tim44 family)
MESDMAELRTARPINEGELLRGLAAGLAGGLVASVVMDAFQALASPLLSRLQGGSGQSSSGQDGSEPTTVRAAEAVSEGVLGHQLSGEEKELAGPAVHYATGIALGGAYGVAAVIEPRVTVGAGLPYGAAVAVVMDEALVPAVGLSGPPWASPASTHAYALASHLVFGLTVEVVRRGVHDLLRSHGPHRDR